MSILLLLAAQSAPPLRTERFVTETPPYHVTAETYPFIRKYDECVNGSGPRTWTPQLGRTQEQLARERIAACGEIRQWALSSGVAAYKIPPHGERDARKFVNAALDTIDAGYVMAAQFGDRIVSGEIKLPSEREPQDQQPPLATVETRRKLPIPARINPELMPYLNCVVAQMNLQQRDLRGMTEENYPKLRLSILNACVNERTAAKHAAVKALGGAKIDRATRPAYVEQVILDVEDNLLVSPWADLLEAQRAR